MMRAFRAAKRAPIERRIESLSKMQLVALSDLIAEPPVLGKQPASQATVDGRRAGGASTDGPDRADAEFRSRAKRVNAAMHAHDRGWGANATLIQAHMRRRKLQLVVSLAQKGVSEPQRPSLKLGLDERSAARLIHRALVQSLESGEAFGKVAGADASSPQRSPERSRQLKSSLWGKVSLAPSSAAELSGFVAPSALGGWLRMYQSDASAALERTHADAASVTLEARPKPPPVKKR
jgi:hypothetical protein